MLLKDVVNSSDQTNSFWVLSNGRNGAKNLAITGAVAALLSVIGGRGKACDGFGDRRVNLIPLWR